MHKPEVNCACVSWGNTSWLWVTQTSTSCRYPCLLVWFWTGHLMSLITCFFTSRVEMTILLHHRAVWKITWDKTCTGTYMRVAQFSSVTQSCPTLCDPVDTRPPCPSPTPRAYSNSCPSSHWCHPAIPSSVVPFSCFQSFPASESFPVSQFFTSVRVASDPPRSQGMTRDTEHRGIMLSSLCILVLLWFLSTLLACFCIPLGSKDPITLNFKNLLFTVQGWRSWWEAALLCAHSEPYEFRKQGSEAAEKTQTLVLLETQPRLEQVRVTTIQMQRRPVPRSQTHRRSASHSTQIASAIAFMFLTL